MFTIFCLILFITLRVCKKSYQKESHCLNEFNYKVIRDSEWVLLVIEVWNKMVQFKILIEVELLDKDNNEMATQNQSH